MSKEEGKREETAAAGADLMSEENAICCSVFSLALGNTETLENEGRSRSRRVLTEEKRNRGW